jgi:K+-sensing histidine kinase KdpD
LTQRLLRAARLDSAQFVPKREAAYFSLLAREAVGKLDDDAARQRFRVTAPAREVPVMADRELILTSLGQLLDNALKYSETGSAIDIEVVTDGPRVVFTLRSKGAVLAPGDCERIFERFYRAEQSQHQRSGTGLGLSIVKKIVQAHCGSAWAEPEAGYGTAFRISLPSATSR